MLQVKVAFNLHTRQYSLRHGSKVIGYADELWLAECTFVVSEATRQRIVARYAATGQRNKTVHAFIVGTPIAGCPTEPTCEVSYNPYKHATFYVRGVETPITHASYVHLTRQLAQDGQYVPVVTVA